MLDDEAILSRTHPLIEPLHEQATNLAKRFLITDTDASVLLRDLRENATFTVTDDTPRHVRATHPDYDVTIHNWNRELAVYTLARFYCCLHHPPDSLGLPEDEQKRRDTLQSKFESYDPPAWETAVTTQSDGDYTESFCVKHLEQTRTGAIKRWRGLTTSGELVRIRYRSGALRMHVGEPETDLQLAYSRMIETFPGSSLSTADLIEEEWPDWAYVTPDCVTADRPDDWEDIFKSHHEAHRERHDEVYGLLSTNGDLDRFVGGDGPSDEGSQES